MSAVVVDTNVAIVANGGRATHADYSCQLECVERLQYLIEHGTVVVDVEGLILHEYGTHLHRSGQPGVGDAFFKFLVDQQYADDRVRRVSVNRTEGDEKGFEELPENTFDSSDRKFLAVAVAAGAAIWNATDSDWREHAPLMDALGVKVKQLCPQHANR